MHKAALYNVRAALRNVDVARVYNGVKVKYMRLKSVFCAHVLYKL
jgi:hypothetical protein